MRVKEPLLAAIAWAATTAGVAAEDVKVSVTQRGLWDIAVSKPGQRSGIMQSHSLKLEILYTSGGAKSQQALVAGSVEIACGGGIEWVIGAYAKGAPLRIIGSEMIGSPDTYWYGVADSPIRSIRDAAGKAHQLVSDFETAQGANTGRSRCIGGL